MCTILEVSDFAKKMWKKIRFKFENSEKFYKGYPRKKKNYMGILGKMNTDHRDPKRFFDFPENWLSYSSR